MPCPSLRSLTAALSAALAITLGGAASSAFAIGTITDINVVDRTTGQVLPVYTHQGRHYVAGRPGARYAVRVHNKAGGRVMTVLSVDGINVVSGETAGIEQNGYVLSSWQRHDVAGWRKSQAQVAAFEFTALPNSYAARTGRPDNVGVIGVAVFRERPVPQPPVQVPVPAPRPYGALGAQGGPGASSRDDAVDSSGSSGNASSAGSSAREQRAERSSPATAQAPAAPAADAAPAARKSMESMAGGEVRAPSRVPAQPESKLGTGHGARENAWVNYTAFERAQSTPDEVITIYYDSRDNLVAQGVIPAPRVAPVPAPQPFPVQPQIGFVPDPPRL